MLFLVGFRITVILYFYSYVMLGKCNCVNLLYLRIYSIIRTFKHHWLVCCETIQCNLERLLLNIIMIYCGVQNENICDK